MVCLGDQKNFNFSVFTVGQIFDCNFSNSFAGYGNLAAGICRCTQHDQLLIHQNQGWQLKFMDLVVAAGCDLGAQAQGFTDCTRQGQGNAAKPHGLIPQNPQHHLPLKRDTEGFTQHAQTGCRSIDRPLTLAINNIEIILLFYIFWLEILIDYSDTGLIEFTYLIE